MATELKELDLFEVSLVDAGDDPLAKVALYKRKDNTDMTDEVVKTKEDWEADIAELNSQIETLKAKVSELEAEGSKADDEEDMMEIDGEKVCKSAIPAPVLKALEEVQKQKEELEKAAAEQAMQKRASEVLPNLKGTLAQKAALLKSIGDDKELLEILQAADALFKELFKEQGSVDTEKSLQTPEQRLDTLVKNYQAEKGVNFYTAYAAVIKTADGRALLKETRKD